MIGRQEQWAGFLIALVSRRINLGELGTAAVVDPLFDSLVLANVEFPGVARRIPAIARVFHHDSSRGLFTEGHLVHALIGHSGPGIPRHVQWEEQNILIVDEGRIDIFLYVIALAVE